MELRGLFPEPDMEWLRANIKLHGILKPITVDQNGYILDGFHRKQIADELGVDCPTTTVKCENEEVRETLSVVLNWHSRELTKDQKKMVADQLAGSGWSQRKIALELGVAERTLGRWDTPEGAAPAAPSGRVKGKDGRSYPAARSTPEQVAARLDKVEEMLDQGCSYREIAAATGLTEKTIGKDVKAVRNRRGDPPGKPPRQSRPTVKPPPAPSVRGRTPDYMDDELEREARKLAANGTDHDWTRTYAMCWNEAASAGNTAWQSEIQSNVEVVLGLFSRLALVGQDPDFRDRMIHTDEGRDSLQNPNRAPEWPKLQASWPKLHAV